MKEFHFSDYIEVLTETYNIIIYSPIYSNRIGLYLGSENEKPIKEISLINSKLTIHYLDGQKKRLEDKIMSIRIDGTFFKRKMKISIEGNLLKYSTNDAILYNLDINKAYNYDALKPNIKTKTINKK